jgi:hypothetical protein
MFLTFMQLVLVGNWHGHPVHLTRIIQGFVAQKMQSGQRYIEIVGF